MIRGGSRPGGAGRVGRVREHAGRYAVQAALDAGLYRGRWLFGSFGEVKAAAKAAAAAGLMMLLVDVFGHDLRPVPLSAVVGGTILAFVLMEGTRYVWRHSRETSRRARASKLGRVVVFGAGDRGERSVRLMSHDLRSEFVPVALLDDDPRKANLTMMGVRVEGTREDLARVARRHHADALLIAVPSGDAGLVRDLMDRCSPLGLDVRVLPSSRELLKRDVTVADIRRPNEQDLFGRHQVHTDLESVSEYLTGCRVVVTGAGGSIGSELCRQIAAFGPAELIMVDRDEAALHDVQLSIEGRALLDSPNLVLADIRDRVRIAKLFAERRPDVVFHAAALKHLPLLEMHPVEALKTNVWGTLAVLDAAISAGVPRFVNISADKAADPCSILGYSKRIAEGLTAWAAQESGGRYLSVRFGNVLGSRGSVLTTFRAQIEAGGPVTVTDPLVERFFMTVEEAVQLVVQAGAIGGAGEVMVMDMGEAVRIAEVAARMIEASGRDIAIEYTGLRPAEKLSEDLFGAAEQRRPSAHPLIHCVTAPPLEPMLVRELDPGHSEAAIALTLAGLSDAMAHVAPPPAALFPVAPYIVDLVDEDAPGRPTSGPFRVIG